MSADQPRPHRPARFADLTEIIDAAGGAAAPGARAELASATAAAVVAAGRASAGPGSGGAGSAGPGSGAAATDEPAATDLDGFLELADRVGLDTLAELWRDADPVSLPGVLWALYLLRQWCRASGADVVRLWRAGEPLAPADAAVAGTADFADAGDIASMSDAVLAGVYCGDLAVALERAAAFFRVVAAGRRALADRADGTDPAAEELALRNERAADGLAAAAHRWRAGTLH